MDLDIAMIQMHHAKTLDYLRNGDKGLAYKESLKVSAAIKNMKEPPRNQQQQQSSSHAPPQQQLPSYAPQQQYAQQAPAPYTAQYAPQQAWQQPPPVYQQWPAAQPGWLGWRPQ